MNEMREKELYIREIEMLLCKFECIIDLKDVINII